MVSEGAFSLFIKNYPFSSIIILFPARVIWDNQNDKIFGCCRRGRDIRKKRRKENEAKKSSCGMETPADCHSGGGDGGFMESWGG